MKETTIIFQTRKKVGQSIKNDTELLTDFIGRMKCEFKLIFDGKNRFRFTLYGLTKEQRRNIFFVWAIFAENYLEYSHLDLIYYNYG